MKRNFFIAALVVLSLFSVGAALYKQFPEIRAKLSGGGKLDDLTVTSEAAVEKVSGLKEVAYYSRMVSLLPSNNGKVVVHIADKPQRGTSGEGLYWKVFVGEMFGTAPDGNFEVWKQFAVDVSDGSVFVFDRKQGELISVNLWRTQRNG